MVVAVTNGLGVVANGLRELGYDVVTYGEYQYPIDALIYTGSVLSGINMQSSNFGESGGVLMINASNCSISKIDNMLKKRTYSPLF